MRRSVSFVLVAIALLLTVPQPVAAYVGPGAGLTIIGAALAFVASIVLGVFGFVWYPLRRLMRRLSKKAVAPPEAGDG